jgi:hypothetical protein
VSSRLNARCDRAGPRVGLFVGCYAVAAAGGGGFVEQIVITPIAWSWPTLARRSARSDEGHRRRPRLSEELVGAQVTMEVHVCRIDIEHVLVLVSDVPTVFDTRGSSIVCLRLLLPDRSKIVKRWVIEGSS